MVAFVPATWTSWHTRRHRGQVQRIDAAEAMRLGLVEYVCDEGEDVVERAKAYVSEISGGIAPLAFAETKSLMYAHMGADYERAFREADVVQWKAVGRPDATEGAKALVEKRAPKFERLSPHPPAPSPDAAGEGE